MQVKGEMKDLRRTLPASHDQHIAPLSGAKNRHVTDDGGEGEEGGGKVLLTASLSYLSYLRARLSLCVGGGGGV
jgi:hypothetical protein